jgi:hypothetical protein
MKTIKFISVALFLIIALASYAQWDQLDIPELRKSSVFDFFHVDDATYANLGFSFMKYNNNDQVWSYAGDGLFENAYYQMFDRMIMYDGSIYTRLGNGIKVYNSSINAWEDLNITWPEDVPYSSNIARIGSTADFFYMVLMWNDGGMPTGYYFTTTDFQNWTQATQVGEDFYYNQLIDGTKDYIWLSTVDGDIVYSEDADEFSSIMFGSVPSFDEPWSYRSRLKADNDNNCLFFEGPDSRLYRYNIETADWDTISNNLPDGAFYIAFEAADNLICALTFSGIDVQSFISNNAGDTWQVGGTGLGVIPQIDALTKVGETNYMCVNLLGQVLVSNNNGSNFTESNTGFINGWHFLELFNSKFYTPQTGEGIYSSGTGMIDFNLDNNGLPNTLNVFMIQDIVATGNKLFAVVVEDLFTETLALYYKSDGNTDWTKIDDAGVVNDMRILGKDLSNSVYVYTYSEVEDKSIEEFVYKVSDNIEITDISDVLSMPHDRLISIIGNNEGHLFLNYEYNDGDDANLFRIYHSNDGGDTWVGIDNNYDNFVPVQVVKNLFNDDSNPPLSIIDNDGNPVYMIRVFEHSGIPYEHKLVKYNIETEQWQQIPQAGLPVQMIYSAAITQENGNYYMVMPHGLYTSTDLSSWVGFDYTGLRDGMVPNSVQVVDDVLFMGTLANGIWTVSVEVFSESFAIDEIDIYPNPSSDVLYIKNLELGTDIRLIDNLGRLLYQSHTNSSDCNIDINNLDSGMYFIEFKNSGKTITRKIMVD